MIRKTVSFAVAALLLQMFCVLPVAAATRQAQDAQLAKVKADVAKHEQKRDKVSVKLKDGSKLNGRITARDDASFTLTDKSGATRSLTYTEVEKVKSAGGLSTMAKIGIAVAAGVGALAISYGIARKNCTQVGCP